MKIANEYTQSIDLEKSTEYAVKGITKICKKIGPRKPGSPEELRAQQWMEKDMKNYCNKTKIEEFTLHRQGFMGFIPFTVACGVASVFVNWFASPIAALVLCVLAFVPLLFEFLMYKEFDDFLFPKQTSHNMIATRSPKGEVKQRIIMVAHSDSQFEWKLNYLMGGLQAKLCVEIPAVVGLIIQTVFAVVCIIVGKGGAAMGIDKAKWFFILFFIVSLVFIPFEISFIFFQSWTKSVPGASDNLSGCYTGMATIKALDEAGVEFENTEVVMICSGSEEAGLRGAKAYAKEHENELKEIPTAVVALDTFRDLEDMAVYDRDLSGTVQHDWGVKHLVKNAAANCGYDLPFASIYIGGSDAAAFTKRGIKATCFAAMNPDPPRYYHTRLDTPENLRPECITAGIEIMCETLCMYDKEGLPVQK
ncbi:MAG: M20/M25/M40 family metallo-hydrolase [Acetobacter sp.]|nr:M20/M25/M40 family metallo-hydrolase [Bacteroides sp.]MCM1341736.1 M20/M25/M40 family metallo-hydrolase [Acetobacter sp.]MCM1432325.1 M20/M25/M40 family metallo-hydrolase [Clostridiales bacterium]